MTLELKGHNLGARHKSLNSLSDSMKQEHVSFENIDWSAGDIINIVKIDLASKTKNVNYILMVLQCEDMFYVSRAIKQCPWLIKTSDYKHIINPKYLHEILYPKMNTKAATKLKKYIKLNLKDCQQVEQFYTYEKNENEALEWLPHCSPDFIDLNFKKHIDYVDISLLKRLCEKTIAVLEIYLESNDNYYMKQKALQATTFLLKVDFKRYLDLVEKHLEYNCIKFGCKSTEYILQQDALRIKNNFITYCNIINIKTFLKYLEKENIKYFLYKLFEDKKSREIQFINFDDLIQFLRAMSDTDRLETIKQVFLDKIYLLEDKYPLPKPLRTSMNNLYTYTYTHKWYFNYDHYWYRFTSFDFAYSEILKLMTNEKSFEEIAFMIDTLIILASNSEKNLTVLVDYMCKKYKNGDVCIKKSFIQKLLKNTFLNVNHNTWMKIKNTFMDDILNEGCETTYDENYIQLCIEFILIHEISETGKISDFIYKSFKFNSLKSYQMKLPEDSKEKIFGFLYNTILNKINSHLSPNKKEFLHKTVLLDSALDLLIDWNKNLTDYPDILNIIRDFIKMNEENSWDVDFSKMYNKKKSWRKDLFAESLKMNPSEPVLVNLLKHDPSLLENYTKIETKLHDKSVSLQRYHKKLKIFWPESICNQLVHAYKDKLKNGTCNKAIIRALCTCMPKESLMQLFIQYIPKEDVINWDNIDEVNLNIQQTLAKNMHIARPQPTPEIVMDYAKGDYLPYVLPSLYSIFYNLNLSLSQKFIPMLFDGKVSLQKHGIRLAFIKLLPEDVKNLLTEVLKGNKNLTIRHVAFTLTFKVLCKQNNPAKIQNLWSVLDQFFNDLTHQENKAIYDLLFEVEKLPLSVQSQFFSKAYSFLKDLLASDSKYYEEMKYSFNNLINYARENVKILCPEFLQNILLEFIDKELPNVDINNYISKIELLSSFIICSDTKESQNDKCQKVLLPFLHKCFKHWDYTNESKYIMRLSLDSFLNTFSKDVRKLFSENHTIMPTEAFKIIENMFKKSVDTSGYYLTFTILQLDIIFLVTFESSYQEGDDWDITCSRILSQFADACKEHLKDHCNRYFENIYVLFERALNSILVQFFTKTMIFEFLKNILHGETFTPLYLMVLKLIRSHSDSGEVKKYVKELFSSISSHTSAEVQIHYYQCRNVHLANIADSLLSDKIKQKYTSKHLQVDL